VTVTVRGRGTEQNAWEEHVLVGALIMESLRAGVILDDPGLVVRKLSRVSPAHVTAEQPAVWTLLEFGSDTAEPDLLAEQLSHALDSPGWYANLYSDGQIYVIFPHRVFRYAREDDARHDQALAYAQSVGVPTQQCDWR
jgi:hypothetical protein